MNERSIEKQIVFRKYPEYDRKLVQKNLRQSLNLLDKKVIVLDDDPTGVQTVHDIYVYTDWTKESIIQGFEDDNSIFFILTNSRGFTEEVTRYVHTEIAKNVIEVSNNLKKDFILISRGDSTLRGHYPLETKVLKETIEKNSGKAIDGEVILPFFLEGGRFTIDNVHYVADGDILMPVGETEFAGDKTFGYKSSHLGEWIEEKSKGEFKKEDVTYITLEELREMDYERIENKLMVVNGFGKIVVNAIDYSDVEVFVTALIHAIMKGKNYIFRSAAALTKVIGGISDKELLTKQELINTENKNGGLILVGSHVNKTTIQLENLKKADFIEFVEFNQHLVVDDKAFQEEIKRVIHVTEENISKGKTVAVYTRRERFDLNSQNKEDELRIAVKISNAITSIVDSLKVRPNFIIAKGGITSSDVGTKGLHVKKALVLGQILKGIPVWLTGNESKFPNMPYVIFPGNVGDENALLDAVTIMQPYNMEGRKEI